MSNPVLIQAIGIPDGVRTDFYTTSPYYPNTVFCFINGILISNDDDDGIIELGGTLIRHKIAPLVGDTVNYYYQESASIGGSIQGPPDMLQAFELFPSLYSIIDLRPAIIDVEDIDIIDESPQMIGNLNLVPELADVLNLSPEIISAEEV